MITDWLLIILEWNISLGLAFGHLRRVHVIKRLDVGSDIVSEGILLVTILDDLSSGHIETHLTETLVAELLPPPVHILPVSDLHLDDLLDLLQLVGREKLLHHQTLLI